MNDDLRTWLHDVANAIDEIESFLADYPADFSAYKADLRTKRAVERNLEIIGEAVARILKQTSTVTLTNARQIVATRNRIIHSYDSVSDELIWSIITRHLPALKKEVQTLLSEA